MAGTNDFLTFAAGANANVMTQTAYAANSALQTGVATGPASAQLYNKHARQSATMASMIGAFIAQQTGANAVDDGTTNTLLTNFILAIQASTRTRFQSNLNFYVNPSSGSDTNSGTSASSAFATLQGAVSAIYNGYDLAGFTPTLNLANGNYVSSASGTPALTLSGRPVGSGASSPTPLVIVGNPSSPGSVTIQGTNANAIQVANGAGVAISGCSFSSTGSSLTGSGINVNDSGYCLLNGPTSFGSCGGPQVLAAGGGHVFISGNYTAGGNGGSQLSVLELGRISVANITVTTTGNPSFAVFCNAESNGTITVIGSTFSGNATGAAYRAVTGGRINTGSNGSANFFPGTIAGTVDSVSSYT